MSRSVGAARQSGAQHRAGDDARAQLATSDKALGSLADKAYAEATAAKSLRKGAEAIAAEMRQPADALLKTTPFSKPIIAAVNGDCAGGGVELLIASDIRAAATHARFGLPEVRYAIYPFGGAAVKLVHQIGHVHAMDLLLTGRLVDAAHAARIGLVNEVLPADRLLPWAITTAATIAGTRPRGWKRR